MRCRLLQVRYPTTTTSSTAVGAVFDLFAFGGAKLVSHDLGRVLVCVRNAGWRVSVRVNRRIRTYPEATSG
jgi:hypothetical protein